MKLKLRLVTNKPIPIDLNFGEYMNSTVAMMEAVELTEKIVVFNLNGFPQEWYSEGHMSKVKESIKEVIKKQYPNITSIEGLEELKLLKE